MSCPAEPPPADTIRAEINRQGPIPFRRFMELALYGEPGGYYRRSRAPLGEKGSADGVVAATEGGSEGSRLPADPFGMGGDYFTNSQLQPVFGRLIAQQIARWRAELGDYPDFSVVELGPGRGETTEVLRERLPDVRVFGADYGADDGPSGLLETGLTGVVFSNEFFDALPVHLVEKERRRVIEHYVEADGDGFRFVDGPVSDPRIGPYLDRYAPGLADGQRIEVNLEALDQLEQIAARLKQGYVLTIDYGYTADQIAGGRRFSQGSLMSYVKHQASQDVLAGPGGRDITAHVNFTALEKRGAELGLVSQGLKTQTQYLMDVGEPDQFATALAAGSEQESFRLRMQLKTLLFGLGETFQVLVQRKLQK
jgi:SAM-dependent MidA family methyltransferase